jgi:hypothetical protein
MSIVSSSWGQWAHVCNPHLFGRLKLRNLRVPARARAVCDITSQRKKPGVVVPAYHPNCDGKLKIGGFWFRMAWAKNETLFPQ